VFLPVCGGSDLGILAGKGEPFIEHRLETYGKCGGEEGHRNLGLHEVLYTVLQDGSEYVGAREGSVDLIDDDRSNYSVVTRYPSRSLY